MDNRKGNRSNADLRANLSRPMNSPFSFLLSQAVSSQMCTRRIYVPYSPQNLTKIELAIDACAVAQITTVLAKHGRAST